MANNSFDVLEKGTNQTGKSDPFSFAALSATQMTLISTALLFINIAYISIIIKRRRYLNLKSILLYLSICISDISSAILLLTMCAFMFENLNDVQPWIHLMLQAELSGSIAVTADSYFHVFLIQAIAIRKPIFYRTRFTTRVRIAFALCPWLFGFCYVLIKTYSLYGCMNCPPLHNTSLLFSKYEVGAMFLAIIVTTGTYSYVIYTAYTRIKERNLRLNKNAASMRKRTVLGQVFVEYRTVTTAGLHLISYLVFFVPLCIVWMIATFTNQNIYTCDKFECTTVFVIWFCRGIVDPFIQIAREPKLQLRWKPVGYVSDRTERKSIISQSNESFTDVSNVLWTPEARTKPSRTITN